MRKILAVTLTVIALLGLCYFFLDIGNGSSKQSANKFKSIQAGTLIGDSSAVNKIYFLSVNSSEVESKIEVNFLNGIKERIEKFIGDKTLNISVITPADLDKILSQKNIDLKGKLLIVPDGNAIDKVKLNALHGIGLTSILFSSEGKKTCVDGNQSPYLWDFGISPSMYSESYFSYANQRYGQLAKELTFLIYSNMDSVSEAESAHFGSVIDGLGFGVLATVKVDSREDDLYKVLRGINNLSPKILLATTSYQGTVPYIQQTHKLGLGFEMALFLSERIPEEVLMQYSSSLDSFIKPSVYLDSYESEMMKVFRNPKDPMTAAGYRGYLVAEILDRIIFKFKNEKEPLNFSRALLEMDGNRIDAPSGAIMIHSKARGLIQPLHVGEYKDGKMKYLQYLGDMSPSEQCI